MQLNGRCLSQAFPLAAQLHASIWPRVSSHPLEILAASVLFRVPVYRHYMSIGVLPYLLHKHTLHRVSTDMCYWVRYSMHHCKYDCAEVTLAQCTTQHHNVQGAVCQPARPPCARPSRQGTAPWCSSAASQKCSCWSGTGRSSCCASAGASFEQPLNMECPSCRYTTLGSPNS